MLSSSFWQLSLRRMNFGSALPSGIMGVHRICSKRQGGRVMYTRRTSERIHLLVVPVYAYIAHKNYIDPVVRDLFLQAFLCESFPWH